MRYFTAWKNNCLQSIDTPVSTLSIYLSGPFRSMMAIKFIHRDSEPNQKSFKTNFPHMITHVPLEQSGVTFIKPSAERRSRVRQETKLQSADWSEKCTTNASHHRMDEYFHKHIRSSLLHRNNKLPKVCNHACKSCHEWRPRKRQ